MTKRIIPGIIALIFAGTAAGAQTPRPLELGIDAGITIELGEASRTFIDIPVQSFRVGFPISPRVSLEPKVRLNIVAGDFDMTSYRAELGLLYHLGTSRYPGAYQRAGMYVRPFAGIAGQNDSDDGDAGDYTNGVVGAGVGYKFPLISRLSSRFEANFAHNFGNGDSNDIGLLAGLSFFTR